MMLSTILIAFFICIADAGSNNVIHHTKFRRSPTFQRLYEDHVLWGINLQTRRECSLLCANDQHCLAFTFLHQPAVSSKLCRGYSEKLLVLNQGSFSENPEAAAYEVSARWTVAGQTGETTTDDDPHSSDAQSATQNTSPAAKTDVTTAFSSVTASSTSLITSAAVSSEATPEVTSTESKDDITSVSASVFEETTTAVIQDTTPGLTQETTASVPAWLHANCTSDGDCHALQSNTTCFADLSCLCIPGYFYSLSTRTCNIDCPPEQLATSYTKYPKRAILLNANTQTLSLEECFSYCSSQSDCRSITYRHSGILSSKCSTTDKVALNMSPVAFYVTPNADHYQRQCL